MTKKIAKQWVQKVQKEARDPPSLKREQQLKMEIDKNTEYNMAMDRIIKSDNNSIIIKPDGVVKIEGYDIPIELDGDVHGVGEGAWESKQTVKKLDNYLKLGYFPIIINTEWCKAKGIDQLTYFRCAAFSLSQWLRAKRRI